MIPESFSQLAEKARPGVVNIRTVKTIKGGGRVFRHFFGNPFGERDPFRDFFGPFSISHTSAPRFLASIAVTRPAFPPPTTRTPHAIFFLTIIYLLPPYIKRESEPSDKENYQTLFAKIDGAVAAPTAGLHFSNRLISKIKKRNRIIWCII